MVEKKDMYPSSLVKASKFQLAVEQSLTGGHRNPVKKDTIEIGYSSVMQFPDDHKLYSS